MLYSVLPPVRLLAKNFTGETVNGIPRLFFLPGEVEQIKMHARLPLLKPYLDYWSGTNPDDVRKTITKVAQTNELIRDFAHSLSAVQQQALLYLVTGKPIHKEFVELGIKTAVDLPKWDYFLDRNNEPIAIMRGTQATQTMLFAREVLGKSLIQNSMIV